MSVPHALGNQSRADRHHRKEAGAATNRRQRRGITSSRLPICLGFHFHILSASRARKKDRRAPVMSPRRIGGRLMPRGRFL